MGHLSHTIIFGPILLANNAGIRVRHTFEKSWAYLLLISYFAMTGVSMVRGEASWGTSLLLHSVWLLQAADDWLPA